MTILEEIKAKRQQLRQSPGETISREGGLVIVPDATAFRHILAVGDIHGNWLRLLSLWQHVPYDPQQDLLVFLGDRLGIDLYFVALFAFGLRIFKNLARLRRHLLQRR